MTKKVHLTAATLADKELVFLWRNDPWIVSLSTSKRQVSWSEHSDWFDKFLANEACSLYIIETEGAEKCGAVRFSKRDDEAEVSIYLLQQHTGQGLGVCALREACRQSMLEMSINTIHAYILKTNISSSAAFSKAGFVQVSAGENCPQGHVEMVIRREI